MRVNSTDETPVNRIGKSAPLSRLRNSARRYTPYGKTPQSRRILPPESRLKKTPQQNSQRKAGLKAKSQTSQDAEIVDLKGMTFKTWKLYKLTPLYKFSNKPKELDKYARLLSAHVKAEGHKGTFIDVFDNTEVGKAVMSQYKGMQIAPDDPEAVQILIKGKTKTVEDTVLLTAVLCGVDMVENPIRKSIQDEFTYYPIMLVKGTISLTDVLTCWLEMQYDCKVMPLTLSSYDLAWMVSMWSGLDDSQTKKKPVELLYTLPAESESLTKITYTIDPTDCQCLWESIHGDEKSEFTGEEVRLFISSLESHFYKVFKVHLSAMQLTRVGTPLCFVGSEGRLKLFLSNNVLTVLRHLTELSTERTFSFAINS